MVSYTDCFTRRLFSNWYDDHIWTHLFCFYVCDIRVCASLCVIKDQVSMRIFGVLYIRHLNLFYKCDHKRLFVAHYLSFSNNKFMFYHSCSCKRQVLMWIFKIQCFCVQHTLIWNKSNKTVTVCLPFTYLLGGLTVVYLKCCTCNLGPP